MRGGGGVAFRAGIQSSMSAFINYLEYYKVTAEAARTDAMKSALLKLACEAYCNDIELPCSFTFFGKDFGAHHYTKVTEWQDQPNLAINDLHMYVRPLSAAGTGYNPAGSFAKTFGKILEVHPVPDAPTVMSAPAP